MSSITELPDGLPERIYEVCELHCWRKIDLQRMFYNEHLAPDMELDLTTVPNEFWNEFLTNERYWDQKMIKAVMDNMPF